MSSLYYRRATLLLDSIQKDLIGMNAQGLEVFEGGEWCEWYDDQGRDIEGWSEDEFDAWGKLSHEEC